MSAIPALEPPPEVPGFDHAPPMEAPYVDDPIDAFAASASAAAADVAHEAPSSPPPAENQAPPPAGNLAPPMSAPVAMQSPPAVQMQKAPPSTTKSRAPLFALIVLLLGGLGAGGYFAYMKMNEKKPEVAANGTGKTGSNGSAAIVKKATPDAAVAVAKVEADAAVAVPTATPDAAHVAEAKVDAAVVATATPDAAVDKPNEVVKPTGASDKLQISSKPAGARVFIDGADQGVTPVKLAGSADRHTMVLLAPGHDLYIGEVDGHGVFDIALKPITPTGGNAGIKVIKCKAKERYYVYVDGAPTGMTCPTERIDTVVGPHTVEVYDIVTDSRRKFDIVVKDERLSARVRIDD
jgi:PEGA domain-containing protein